MGMYAVDAADDLGDLGNSAREGRAAATLRRRQLSQGKQALNGDGDGMAAGADAGAPPAAENLQANGAGAPAAASDGQGAPNGAQGAPGGTAVATDGVAGAHAGRAISMQRRRQLSQGKEALNGDGDRAAAAAASDGQGAPNGAQGAPGGTAVATDGVAGAHAGRAISMQRRRQLSQGKEALNGDGGGTAAAPGGAPPAEENLVDGAGSGREQARARRAEASRFGSAGVSRPQQQGRVTYPPKVIVSPTQRGQRVTGLRIGPGVKVTGDEPGEALPVSGTQYFAADGPAPAMGGRPKVG
ncbi:MAG TPA: CsoS2 family carboxysome shell protein, partial [Acidimicrobiales bacterium]|nr:CsoS2 family carboxysome shell protein [Acidimicrobiales bacterium]